MEKTERELSNRLMMETTKKNWKKIIPVIVVIAYFGYQVSRIPEPEIRLFLSAIATFVGTAIILLLIRDRK